MDGGGAPDVHVQGLQWRGGRGKRGGVRGTAKPTLDARRARWGWGGGKRGERTRETKDETVLGHVTQTWERRVT
ncbi:hypothetical protein CLOP_g19363 [Closterium sp. NIES-67]|nr:hypothetical protein CLOP_g19363 [Closterium sp. NIES-67]